MKKQAFSLFAALLMTVSMAMPFSDVTIKANADHNRSEIAAKTEDNYSDPNCCGATHIGKSGIRSLDATCSHTYDYSEENSTVVDGYWVSKCTKCGDTIKTIRLESPTVTFVQNNDSSVTIRWTSDSAATSYRVRRRIDVDTSSYETVYEGTATSYTDNDIKIGEHYIYRVYAYNSVKLPSPKKNSHYIADHNYGEWVVTTPATTTKEGVMTRTCKSCGAVQTKPIEKLEPIDPPADAPVFSVSSEPIMPGDVGTIVVSLDKNPGIISWRLALDYDPDAIEITDFETGAFEDATYGSLTDKPFTFSWCDALNGNNTATGEVAKISFMVKEDVEPGDYDISLSGDPEDFFDDDLNNVAFAFGSGNVTVCETPVEPVNPENINYTPGNGCVNLDWDAVEGAEKYAVAGYVNGKWQILAKCDGTSYVLSKLTADNLYIVSVIARFDGQWLMDFSNSIIVTPNAGPAYPTITSIDYSEEYHQFRLNWSDVPNAQNYGVAVYLSGKWRIQTQSIPAGTTSFTSPKLTPGKSYRMLIVAKVDGKWDLTAMTSRAFTVDVK